MITAIHSNDTDSSLENGIIINKSITIDGQGHTIDGGGKMRIFQVTNNAVVTLKNITFENGKTGENGCGGAVLNDGAKNITVINCTFNKNSAYDGGAIYHVYAINCTFINNTASRYGGAMFDRYAYNCTFINNHANYGGAVQGVSAAYNCTFINNTAKIGGSAMYQSKAYNCTFVNNNVYTTIIYFYINDDMITLGDTVLFSGLPECKLTVNATKDGSSETFNCTNNGWKIENLEPGIYNALRIT